MRFLDLDMRVREGKKFWSVAEVYKDCASAAAHTSEI